MKRYFETIQEVENLVLESANEVHPYYNNPKTNIIIYDKTKYESMQYDTIIIGINFDKFGKIEIKENVLYAEGKRCGVGYTKSNIETLKEAIYFLVEKYFN